MKAWESLRKYYRDEPAGRIPHLESFKPKIKITGNIPCDGNTKNVGIVVTLKYLSNICRTLEMPLINCEINLVLN